MMLRLARAPARRHRLPIIDSTLPSSVSSSTWSAIEPNIPGSFEKTSLSGPIFWMVLELGEQVVEAELTLAGCARRLLRPVARRPPPRSPSPGRRCRPCPGCGTRDPPGGTLPGGRRTLAVPMNLIGTPVTALTARAAPPRASPSSLVSTTPSIELLVEGLGDVDGVPAHQGVADQQRVGRRDFSAESPPAPPSALRRRRGGRPCRR